MVENLTAIRTVDDLIIPQRTCNCEACEPSLHLPSGAVAPPNASPLLPCYVQGTNALMPELRAGVPPPPWQTDCFTAGWRLQNDTTYHWFDDMMNPVVFADEAARQAHGDEWVRRCLEEPLANDPPFVPRLLLVGDSHSGVLATTFLSALKHRMPVHFASSIAGFDVYAENGTLVSGAYYTDDASYGTPGLLEYLGKSSFTKAVWRSLRRTLRAGDIVVAVTAEFRFPSEDLVQQHVLFLRELHRLTHSRHARMLLLGDVPQLQQSGRSCMYPSTVDMCTTHLAFMGQIHVHDAVQRAYTELAASLPDVYYFDLRPLLCDGVWCGAVVPGTEDIAFLDTHHISSAGALYLAPFINCFLESQGLLPPSAPRAYTGQTN